MNHLAVVVIGRNEGEFWGILLNPVEIPRMKAALIGAGLIAQQHLGCLRSLREIALVGVCDLSRAMAESAAERFGVDAWFTDHHAMLERVRPDVVHITTPPQSHFKLAMDALAAGAHVIVEKPITVSSRPSRRPAALGV